MEALTSEQCSLDFVKARLPSESIKRKNNFDADGLSNDEAAFYGGRANGSKLKCFACGKVGHNKMNCPTRPKGQDGRQADRSKSGRAKLKGRANVADSEVAFMIVCQAKQQRE